MTKRTTKKAAGKVEPRVRFNWGFWDAVNDRFGRSRGCKDEVWISRHFDKAFAAGYSAGKNWRGEGQPETSDTAWAEYQETK